MSRIFPPSGTDGLVTPASAVYDNLSALTWSFWIYRTDEAALTSYNILVKDPNNFYSPGVEFATESGGAPNNSIFVYFGLQVQNIDASIGNTDLPLNTWTNVIITHDWAGDKKARIYLNGVQDTYFVQSASSSQTDDSGGGYYIGDDAFGGSGPFNMAEFAIWNKVLSGAEITAAAGSHTGVSAVATANLVGYWHICGLDDPEPDSSGNGNDAALVGNPAQFSNSPGYSCGGGPVAYSFPDCRDYGIFPNDSRNVQDTLTYDVCPDDSRTAGAPVDSRTAGAPDDSRVSPNIPLNSRNDPPF